MTHTTLCITVPNTKWPLQHTSDWQTRHHHPLAVWYRFRKTWLKITTSLMHALSRNVQGVTSLWTAVSRVKVRRLTPSLGAMITTADGGGRRLEKCIIISWFHWFISDEVGLVLTVSRQNVCFRFLSRYFQRVNGEKQVFMRHPAAIHCELMNQ